MLKKLLEEVSLSSADNFDESIKNDNNTVANDTALEKESIIANRRDLR